MSLTFNSDSVVNIGLGASGSGIYNNKIYFYQITSPNAIQVIDNGNRTTITLPSFFTQTTLNNMFIIDNYAYFINTSYQRVFDTVVNAEYANTYISCFDLDSLSFIYFEKHIQQQIQTVEDSTITGTYFTVTKIINRDTNTIDLVFRAAFKQSFSISVTTLFLENGGFQFVETKELINSSTKKYETFTTFNDVFVVNFGYGYLYTVKPIHYYYDDSTSSIKYTTRDNLCRINYAYNNYFENLETLISTVSGTSGLTTPIYESYDYVYWFANSKYYKYNKNIGVDTEESLPVVFSIVSGVFSYYNTNSLEWGNTFCIAISSNYYSYYMYTIDITKYDNNYIFYNNEGTIKRLEINDAPPIQKIRCSYTRYTDISVFINISINYITNQTRNYTYGEIADSQHMFLGMALNASSQVPFIKSKTWVSFTPTNISTYFYDVLGFENGITLYSSSSEINRVDKSDYITKIADVQGAFREDVSVVNPVFRLEYDGVVDFNYIYIPKFDRYYFVNDVAYIRTNLVEVTCEVDVLMSYSNAIRNQKAFVDRNEFNFIKDIYNDMLVPRGKTIIVPNEVSNNVYNLTHFNPTSYVICGYDFDIIDPIYDED